MLIVPTVPYIFLALLAFGAWRFVRWFIPQVRQEHRHLTTHASYAEEMGWEPQKALLKVIVIVYGTVAVISAALALAAWISCYLRGVPYDFWS